MAKRARRIALVAALSGAAALLVSGVAWATNPFTDISSDTHAADIDAIYNAGITSGCTATTYCPNNPVTRSQMATFLARVAAVGSTSSPHFPLTNAKGQTQSYCATRSQIPRSLGSGPCQTMTDIVDSTGNAVTSSVAIGTDGLPIVAYFALATADLRVAHCLTLSCSSATITQLDTTSDDVGREPSIAIGTDGFPVISYRGDDDLKVAHCTHIDCSAGTGYTALIHNPGGPVGAFSSIAIGNDGLPLIASYNFVTSSIDVTHCTNVACTAATTTAAAIANTGATTNPVAIGTDGLGVIAYAKQGTIFLAHCTNVACSSVTTATVDDDPAYAVSWPSIAIGSDGFPVITYIDIDDAVLLMRHCESTACTTSSVSSVAGSGNGGFDEVAIGVDGKPIVVFYDTNLKDLVVTHCGSITSCTSSNGALDTRLDQTGDVGTNPSLTIGIDGQPIVFYRDTTNTNLKVARPPLS